MKSLFILNDPPYGSERSYSALRRARALDKQAGQAVDVFLMGGAVACAKAGQQMPEGYYNAGDMVRMVAANGNVALCGTCMTGGGIGDADVADGARRSTVDELAAWMAAADKIPVF